MRYALTEQFLAKCFEAKRGELRDAAEVAAWFLAVSREVGLTTFAILEARERDANALHLAGQGVPRTTIAVRLGISRVAVYDAIKRHQQARRAALKAAG